MNRQPESRQNAILRMVFQFAALILLYAIFMSVLHSGLARVAVNALAVVLAVGILVSAAWHSK